MTAKVIKSLEPVFARSGSVTAKVFLTGGRSFLLHSIYDPEKEARDWLKHIELSPNTAYLVLGFGLGYHVKALLDALPENCHIYVVEYSDQESLAKATCQIIPYLRWMQDHRLTIYTRSDIRWLAGQISDGMSKKHVKKITLCRHYPTMRIHQDFYTQVEKQLVPKVKDLFMTRLNFSLAGAGNYIENFWRNLPYIASSPGITKFRDKFKNIPAIIVSAGPSLNKNVEQIKEYVDKAVIICSGSALGALRKHDIAPHFLAAVDPFEIMYDELKQDLTSQTALLSPYETQYRLIIGYPGKRFFCGPAKNYVSGKLTPLLPATVPISLNVSVASLSFHFALYIGAEPIIFTGQDMAFSPEASHADGVKAHWNLDEEKQNYCLVKGQNGETLKTCSTFKELLEYFESCISRIKDRVIINATEGGAYLRGAQHMALRSAAARYFTDKIDIYGIIDNIASESRPNKYGELHHAVSQIADDLSGLKDYTDKFINEMEQFANTVKLGDKAGVQECLDRMENYFLHIKTLPVYDYIKFYIEPLLELFLYQQREGLDIADQYFGYYNLLRKNVLKLLEKIHSYVTDAMAGLEIRLNIMLP